MRRLCGRKWKLDGHEQPWICVLSGQLALVQFDGTPRDGEPES